MINIFDNDDRFTDLDPRKNRKKTKVNSETLFKRFSVLIPPNILEGKTVLDLGSALGASGHWCLYNKAKHYTGIEIQDYYVEKSNELLSEYYSEDKFTIIKSDIKEFLTNNNTKYDVVLALGIVFGYLDTFTLCDYIFNSASDFVSFESFNTERNECPAIHLKSTTMVSTDDINIPYAGLSSLPSVGAIGLIASYNGFDTMRVYPDKITSVEDFYNSVQPGSRYMTNHKRSNISTEILERVIIKSNMLKDKNA